MFNTNDRICKADAILLSYHFNRINNRISRIYNSNWLSFEKRITFSIDKGLFSTYTILVISIRIKHRKARRIKVSSHS